MVEKDARDYVKRLQGLSSEKKDPEVLFAETLKEANLNSEYTFDTFENSTGERTRSPFCMEYSVGGK